jgi:putative transposase
MPFYRRPRVRGGTYFFTVVTERRAPILCTDLGRRLLHDSIESCRRDGRFELVATVLLMDGIFAACVRPCTEAETFRP